MIQVAVMGYGTVGSGVVEVIEKNKEERANKKGKTECSNAGGTSETKKSTNCNSSSRKL